MSDALINGLAGAGGGIIAQLITYPLQTVNTRQQTDRDPQKRKNKAGTVEQMLQVVQQEGWGRLYSGLAPSLVGTACSQALVLVDAKGIKENCMKLSGGEDLYALFAGILTTRPWNRVIDPAVDHLAIQVNASDHSELQMHASLYFPQNTELLHKLPRIILLMLKTNDCLRSVNNALIKRPSVESFIIIG